MKFLNETGLQYLWNKIKGHIAARVVTDQIWASTRDSQYGNIKIDLSSQDPNIIMSTDTTKYTACWWHAHAWNVGSGSVLLYGTKIPGNIIERCLIGPNGFGFGETVSGISYSPPTHPSTYPSYFTTNEISISGNTIASLDIEDYKRIFKIDSQNVIINDSMRVGSLVLIGNLSTPRMARVFGDSNIVGPTGTNAITLARTGDANFNGVVTSRNIQQTSDANVKRNIAPIDSKMIDEVGNVEFKQFKFNKEYNDDNIHVGVIAQDLESANLGNFVHQQNGVKSVNYIEFLCLKIAQLEKRISELEKL